MATSSLLSGYRFGPFALDLRSGDLTRNGRRLRLQEKPRSILIALAEHPGEVITRAELRERLWPEDTFVDFEDGLNTAMRKLREALEDDPQTPRFIETVRGRGYRLVVPVEPIAPSNGHAEAAVPGVLAPSSSAALAAAGSSPAAPAGAHHRLRIAWFFLGCAMATVAGGLWYWLAHAPPVLSLGNREPLLIADFENQTGDPRFDHALGTALNVSLEQSRYLNIYSRLQAQTALRLMKRNGSEPLTAAVGREICQRENLQGLVVPGITRAGHQYRLTAQLIDPSTGIAVRSYAESAPDEEHILDALDSISTDIRRDLGESHYEIHQSHRPLPEVTTASLQALEDYAQGSNLFGAGRWSDAVRLYKRAIAADPGFAMAHAALGYADYSFFANQPALGEQEYRSALSLALRTTEREHAWIEVRYAESQGRVEDALQLYRVYLQRYPGDWAAQYSYARLLRMHGHAPESVEMYRQLLQTQPDDAGTWIELATCYADLNEWGPSIEAYRKAFSLEPSRMLVANINHEYGFALVEAGQEARAEEVFSATLADPQNYPNGERSLAFLDMDRGRYAGARRRLMLALAASPRDGYAAARIRYGLASIAAAQGNQREQIDQLDRIMARFETLPAKVLYGSLVGQAYARAGQTAKARQILDRIAPVMNDRVDDQVAFVAILKAEIATNTGDLQGALQFLKPPAPTDSGPAAVVTREELAHVYQAMGNGDEAIAWYRQFVKSGVLGWEPQRYLFAAYYNLALDYRQKGDRLDALDALNKILVRWNSADPGLPLLAKARQLRDRCLAAR